MDSYQALANAIVELAVKDYKTALKYHFRHPDKQEYTWWSYRFNSRAKNKGWRIDYCMVSESVRPMLKEARILGDVVHSDHCPMLLEITE